MLAWLMLAVLGSRLVSGSGLPFGVVALWFLGLGAIVAMRWRLDAGAAPTVATVGIVLALAHGAGAWWLARAAEAAAAARFPGAQAVQANPMPAQPFAHRIVVAHADRYRIIEPDGSVRELPVAPLGPAVQRALSDPSVRGFTTWMRFPWWQEEQVGRDTLVRLYDLRYAEPDRPLRGIGYAEVMVRAADASSGP